MSEPTSSDGRDADNAPTPDLSTGDPEELVSRPPGRISVVIRGGGGRFMGALWEHSGAQAYAARLLAESQVSHYKPGNGEPRQAPEIRVLDVKVQ